MLQTRTQRSLLSLAIGGAALVHAPRAFATCPPELLFRPEITTGVAPTTANFATSVEYERWKAEGRREEAGSRVTAVASYSQFIDRKSRYELGFVAPYQNIRTDEFDFSNTNDFQVSLRRHVRHKKSGSRYIASVNLLLPTGKFEEDIGIGEWGIGFGLTAVRALGNGRTLGYVGGSWSESRQPDQLGSHDPFRLRPTASAYVGALTQLSPRLALQYELEHQITNHDENSTRLLIGPRIRIGRNYALQINARKDFQLDGKPEAVSLGFASRF